MNGDLSTRSVVISDHIVWPNGLTIDHVEDRIYWVDASLHYIHSADLDGSNRYLLAPSPPIYVNCKLTRKISKVQNLRTAEFALFYSTYSMHIHNL